MKQWLFLCAMATAASVGHAMAATAPTPDGLRACMAENDDARRLACYDRELNRRASTDAPAVAIPAGAASTASAASGSKGAGSAAAVSAAPVAAVAEAVPHNDFGVRGSEVARQREQQQPDDPQAALLTAKVTEVSKQARGELVITLENGQVWLQKKVESYFPLKSGDQIHISPGALGAYWLKAPSGRSTPVTRVR